MLGPLRAWAASANIGQDFGKDSLQGTSEMESEWGRASLLVSSDAMEKPIFLTLKI